MLDLLKKCLETEQNLRARIGILVALHELGDLVALDELKKCLDSDDIQVREIAQKTLSA
jgi:HEAT repeat protein